MEATIDALSHIVDIQPRDRRRFKRLREESKSFESVPIRTRLSDEEVARFIAQRFRFPGWMCRPACSATTLWGPGQPRAGLHRRINQKEAEAMEDWPDEQYANYRGTEYIGKLGIEQSYESELHGITGFEEVETSAGGRAVRRLRSNPATPGNTVHLSIDIKSCKALVERLYGNRRGALVAIDPRNGEVLAFVSSPRSIPTSLWMALTPTTGKNSTNRPINRC